MKNSNIDMKIMSSQEVEEAVNHVYDRQFSIQERLTDQQRVNNSAGTCQATLVIKKAMKSMGWYDPWQSTSPACSMPEVLGSTPCCHIYMEEGQEEGREEFNYSSS